MLTSDDTPPFHLLNKGLRARASKLETEGHLEVAFRSDRVAEVLCNHGGSETYATQLACVLHVFSCQLLHKANQHRLRQNDRPADLPSDSSDSPLDSESEPDGYDTSAPSSPAFGYLRIRNIVGAACDRELRQTMVKTVEFSGLFGPGSTPKTQKQTQYHYRWPLGFVVRNLRKDWGESSSDSSDGPLSSTFACCNSKKSSCNVT